MQIVIPMSGFGERFRHAGYRIPKPLIDIDGKPMIAWVIDLFPNEKNFYFICNQKHLDETDFGIRDILNHYCPHGKIIAISPHKFGPVHAVQQIKSHLRPDLPVVVNYCDFSCYWDWHTFKRSVQKDTSCMGAIPAYKGFHPHSLGNTHYAYMQERNGWVTAIQEKEPFTHNRMEEYASSGTYYFASAKIMFQAFDTAVAHNWKVNNEYYVSLAYRHLIKYNLPVKIYPLQHFMQWGTPKDLAEYLRWSSLFKRLMDKMHAPSPAGSVIVPMAGMGKRFSDAGYTLTKPLISVSGQPMVIQATDHLPPAQQYCFVLRGGMPMNETITCLLNEHYPQAVTKKLDKMTAGQACTALIGLEALQEKMEQAAEPITFGACDFAALYDHHIFVNLCADPTVDIIVWGVRGHPHAMRHPEMYGWIDENNGVIKNISVKQPLQNPTHDPIVLGTFTFCRATHFEQVVEHLIAHNMRVNNEFYLDSCVNVALEMGLSCRLLEVEHYMSWGTPNDLKTFEYWQSCFSQWEGHPYRLHDDSMIPSQESDALACKYKNWSVIAGQ